MIQPGCAVKALARVAVSCGAAGLLVSKGVVVQRLQYVARFIGDQPGAALRVCVYVPGLSFFAFADLQSHSIGGMHIGSFFPCAAVLSGALQHDFAVGARCVQHPLGFPGVVALLPGAADASAQCVVAVAHSGVAALNFSESVVCAPAVVGGLLRGLLFDEVAACIPAVVDGVAGAAFLCELVQLVVAVAGFVAVAVFFCAVAYAVVLVGTGAALACLLRAFAGEFAVCVVLPGFDGFALACGLFAGLGQPAFGVALVAVAGQGLAAGTLVVDFGEVAICAVLVVAARAVGALDLCEAARCVVGEARDWA